MTSFYLQVEAVNLDDFIFDTDDLSTRRGGSLMLLNAIGEVTRTLEQESKSSWNGCVTVVQEGASVGLYRVEVGDGITSEDIAASAREAARKVARHATFGVACLAASGEDAAAFRRDRQHLRARIRWDQLQRPSLRAPAWNASGGAPCDLDTVRPGSVPDSKGGEKITVSTPVSVKRSYGKGMKSKFYKDETAATPYELPADVEFVSDLEGLTTDTGAENLSRKMALIYIDGNGFGGKFDAVASVGNGDPEMPWEAYARASRDILCHRRKMLADLLEKMGRDSSWQNEGAYRIETLLWGGDEILWVVPAWKGWETLQHFFEKAKVWKIGDKGVTHAAGVVFCHHNAPIQRMIDIARGLCETAKDVSRKRNLVAFHVSESFDFMSKDLDGFRKALVPGHEKELVLKADEMAGVPCAFAQLRKAIARKQVYSAAQAAHESFLPFGEDTQGTRRAECILTEEARKAKVGVDALKRCLGTTDEVFWYHVRELWDYIPAEGIPAPASSVVAGEEVAP